MEQEAPRKKYWVLSAWQRPYSICTHSPPSPSLALVGAVCISMQVKNICLLDPPTSLARIRGSTLSLLLPFHERRRSRRRRRSRSRLKTFAAHLKTKKFSRLLPRPPPLGGGVFSTLAVRRSVLHWRSKKTTGTRGGREEKFGICRTPQESILEFPCSTPIQRRGGRKLSLSRPLLRFLAFLGRKTPFGPRPPFPLSSPAAAFYQRGRTQP